MDESHFLTCDHCGCEAIESPDGMFSDGQGEKCQSCGFPGHVTIDDADAEYVTASWRCSEELADVCQQSDCEECRERREYGSGPDDY